MNCQRDIEARVAIRLFTPVGTNAHWVANRTNDSPAPETAKFMCLYLGMSFILAPFTFVFSMLLLLAGGFCLVDAQSSGESGQSLFPAHLDTAAVGIALVLAGALNLFSSIGRPASNCSVVATGSEPTDAFEPAVDACGCADVSQAASETCSYKPSPRGSSELPNPMAPFSGRT